VLCFGGPFFSLFRSIVTIPPEVCIRCHMVCEKHLDIQERYFSVYPALETEDRL